MKRCLYVVLLILTTTAFLHAQAPGGPQHSASLSWTASVGATGYNIYRCNGTCTAPTGTFTKLNTTSVTTANFTDTNVVNNTTYSWCVTATATNFESACSNVVTASIPKDATGPPTSLSVTTQ